MKSKKTDGLVRRRMLLLGQAGFVALVVGLGACTKSLPYKVLLKEQVLPKSLIDPSAEYIYLPSTAGGSRTLGSAGYPFMYDDEKIVKLELTREALRAYEVEIDASHQGNPQNRKLVFEVPVSHVEYNCQKDRFGNCQNQEEENSLLTWDQKSQFKPDFSRINVTEVNFMPENINKLLLGRTCATEVSNKPLDYEFSENHINIRVERTMANDARCVGAFDFLFDLTSSLVSNYSLVKLSAISTQGYKGQKYPGKDEGTFGFFDTVRAYNDVDKGQRLDREVRLMNRWNPRRGEVVYYLSEGFNKPEYEPLKKAAYRTIKRINDGLAEAEAQFRLVLKEPEAGVRPGDLRYSMILLVEDAAVGLLGYGPSVVNPRTGEILQATASMYPEVIKRVVERTYREIQKLREERNNPSGASITSIRSFRGNGVEGSGSVVGAAGAGRIARSQKSKDTDNTEIIPGTKNNNSVLTVNERERLAGEEIKKLADLKERYGFKDYAYVGADPIDMLMAQKHSCLLRFQAVGGGGSSGSIDPKIIEAFDRRFGSEKLKDWEKLSATEKQFVLDLVMPEAFAGILIHELGHTLGLRHNFEGSEDKANFYTEEELSEKGIDYYTESNSTSVMEYMNNLHGSAIFGKYDIAALRFGYARKVMTTEGDLIEVGESLEALLKKAPPPRLKKFEYCTDGHVGINAGCKRWDSGVDYDEIADDLISRYHALVERARYRRNQADFSSNFVGYARAIDNIFYDLRTFMEVAERVNYLGWPYESIKGDEVMTASIKAGKFLEWVLKIPEQTCVLGNKARPSEAPEVRLFSELRAMTMQPRVISCSGLDLSKLTPPLNQYVVIDEVGRPFNDVKSFRVEDWRTDQIDVRGSWIDKTLAAKYLFARRLNETGIHFLDKHTDSFMDLPELKVNLLSTVLSIMGDGDVTQQYEVRGLDGRVVQIDVPLRVLKTHDISSQFSSVANFLAVPSERAFHFIEVLGQQMVRQKRSAILPSAAGEVLDAVGIYKTLGVVQSVLPDDAYVAVVDGIRYAALKGNSVARHYLGEIVAIDILVEAVESVIAQGGDKILLKNEIFQPVIDKKADPNKVLNPSAIQKKMLRLDGSDYDKLIRDYSELIVEGTLSLSQEWDRMKASKRELRPKNKRVLDMLPVLNEQ